MNIRALSILSLAVVLVSCSKSNPDLVTSNQPSSTNQTLSGARMTGSPFKGSISYTATSEYDLPCDCGSYFSVGTYAGSGTLTHLGLSTSDIKPCVSPIFSSTGAFMGDHVGVECAYFIAADGDKLYLSIHPYDILFTPSGPVGNVNVDFVGGTGKFASATGSFTGTVSILSTTTARLDVISGTISY